MCFTPTISISIAIIEFALASILLLFFPKSDFRNFFAFFIYLLGFYQFTEFMLCSGNALFWATMGFITYTFLPAIALHAVLKIFKRKFNIIWVYVVPVIASILAISIPGFIIKASCERYFISIDTIFINSSPSFLLLGALAIYTIYYFGFLVLTYSIILKDYLKQKNKIKREIELVEMVGILLMTVPTLVLLILFPVFGIMFPSVLCAFAIFVAISAFIGVYLKGKLRKKK